MKRISVIAISLFTLSSLYADVPTSPGKRVWEVAADDLNKTITIESQLDDLDNELASDMDGTFTGLDDLLAKICTVQSQAELLATQVNIIEVNFNDDVSKLCTIESKVNALEQQAASIDTQNTFTALDTLQTTLCSKVELLNAELSNTETEIANITQQKTEHTQTIASKLNVTENNVNTINSILDNIPFDVSLTTIDSLIDVIDVCLQTVNSKLGPLESTIITDFAGTFTALDANLQKACTIESLVDNIPMSLIADLSGVYTSLSQLDKTICTIESKVDNLDMSILSIESDVDILNSNIDQTLSKLCVLESKTDNVAYNQCFSLLENIGANLSNDCSILELLNNNQLLEKTCTIESKVDIIINDLASQNSKLEIIDSETDVIENKICTIEMNNISISKLDNIDSKVDSELIQAITICSLIDEIDEQLSTIDSKVDGLSPALQTIESKLCSIEPKAQTICSNLDILNPSLQTTNSKLDNIGSLTQSSLENLFTIESDIDASCSKLEQLPVDSLNSKLDTIESIVCTIESNMDIVGELIGEANMKAIDLEADFASTWTILDAIENKLCTSESKLENADNNLQSLIDIVDFSGIFTAIEKIQLKACTVDSKVDIAISLINDVDFSGVFTALDALESKVCLIDDLVQTVSAGVFVIRDALGTPIYQSDVGTTGYTINTPGRYYLAENINYMPAVTSTAAIGINASNVFLDLNNMTLRQTSTTLVSTNAISFSFVDNIAITNGTIDSFDDDGILIESSSNDIILSNLHLTNNAEDGICFAGGPFKHLLIKRLFCTNNGADGLEFLANETGEGVNNLVIKDSAFLQNSGSGIRLVAFPGEITNVFIKNVEMSNNIGSADDGFRLIGNNARCAVIDSCTANDNGRDGIVLQGTDCSVVRDCITSNNAGNGLFVRSFNALPSNENVVINNTSIANADGIQLRDQAADCRDNYIAFNTFIENTININELDLDTGPNTYLGNFSFNSTSTGDPNNTNYSMKLSDITGKFITVAQTGVFPATEPTEWHNINMLP